MKICSVKGCFEEHNTKYSMCDSCREYSRNKRRAGGKYKINDIINICEKNGKQGGYGEILKIIESSKNDNNAKS